MNKNLRSKVSLKNPWHLLGLGFGSGLSPKMPGTMGSLVAMPLILALSNYSPWLFVLMTIIACIVGVKICSETCISLGVHDHGSIVWDEIAGMLVTFMFVPITWWTLVAGFLFFRLFDIAKPFPISLLDKKVKGGFGIMLDDIIAGIMACVLLHALIYSFPVSL